MFYQRGQGGVHLLFSDQVIVVQDQDQVAGECCKQVNQLGEQGLERWGSWGLQLKEQRGKVLGVLGLQGRDDIGPEQVGVIIFLIQRQPADSSVVD